MHPGHIFPLLAAAAVTVGSAAYLVKTLRQEKQLISLVGLFCIAMGLFLLLLDLGLIAVIHGVQHIPAYLLFNRLVVDSGFAGRWMLTVYVFIGAGVIIAVYLLARKLLTRFNK